jgi:hypothetical protein
MEAIKIPNIETAQHTIVSCGKRWMVLVHAFNHRGFHRGLHVDAARPERMNQAMVHGIFIKVEAKGHLVFPGRACCVSSLCASASSVAMSALISSRLA